MKDLHILIVVICLLSNCTISNNGESIKALFSDYNYLSNDSIPFYVNEIASLDWYNYYKKFIHEDNPEFVIKNADSIHYFIVPSLNIPIENLSDFESNILNYLDRGRLSVNNGELLIFEGDTLLLKFTVLLDANQKIQGITKLDFNSYLKQISYSHYKNRKLCFKITLTNGTGIFPLPTGTFVNQNETIAMLMDGDIVSIRQLHKGIFSNPKDFDSYIGKIVDLAR
ncbi:hypothetical protein [Roseimarinus sediminis]|uniref:hypothetical protein n=1 Tax=Roseimarinus sediminis TaxID=1610899 RepID=UPI003D24A6D8